MIVAYIDGGARGNPGPAGFGVRIEQPDGTLAEEFHESIGTATNNVAEYRALIAALEWARSHGHREVHVKSDSLLLVQQMLGSYKVRNAGLQPLYAMARLLALEIGHVTFEHVGRALNAPRIGWRTKPWILPQEQPAPSPVVVRHLAPIRWPRLLSRICSRRSNARSVSSSTNTS